MNLQQALERAKAEEDVKDAYIKALGLKSYFKGLVDIQTKEVSNSGDTTNSGDTILNTGTTKTLAM
jgi:hypothetical protein